MEEFVTNHAETAADINLFQTATIATQWWPSMIPSNNITRIGFNTVVYKQKCFSNHPNCDTDPENNLSPHVFHPSMGNMTHIHFRSGAHVDYVDASYTTTSNRVVHQTYGSQTGGVPSITVKDLILNPIVKIQWFTEVNKGDPGSFLR